MYDSQLVQIFVIYNQTVSPIQAAVYFKCDVDHSLCLLFKIECAFSLISDTFFNIFLYLFTRRVLVYEFFITFIYNVYNRNSLFCFLDDVTSKDNICYSSAVFQLFSCDITFDSLTVASTTSFYNSFSFSVSKVTSAEEFCSSQIRSFIDEVHTSCTAV